VADEAGGLIRRIDVPVKDDRLLCDDSNAVFAKVRQPVTMFRAQPSCSSMWSPSSTVAQITAFVP
jgi:hypothetical protein